MATMAWLRRAGRYDRMPYDVLTLTGQGPPGVQGMVRRNGAEFAAPVKDVRANADARAQRIRLSNQKEDLWQRQN